MVVLTVWTAGATGGQTNDGGEPKGNQTNYRELIQGLVSPNKPMQCDNRRGRVSTPADYDWEAQERIEKNRRILYEHCEEALPFLMEGCTDTRYSLTWRSDGYADNACVGDVCLQIVASHLELFRKYMMFDKPRYYAYTFVPRINGAIGEQVTGEKKKEIEEWWRGRKGRSLLELQIEAFDRAIEKRKQERNGLRNGTREQSDATEEIERLVAVRDKLKKDRHCLPPYGIPRSVRSPGRKTTDR